METRPKIKISLSKPDKTLEWTSSILLVIMWSLTIFTFLKLPNTIPTHFSASGEVDNYGGKATFLVSPILATAIYFAITQLSKFPHILNYATELTIDNAPQQYRKATRTLRLLKLIVLTVFTLLILFTYLPAIGITKGLGKLFLPLAVGLLQIPTIILIGQSLTKKK